MQHGGGLGAGCFSEKQNGGHIPDAGAFGKLCGGEFFLGIAQQHGDLLAAGGRFFGGGCRALFLLVLVPEEPHHHGRGRKPDQPQGATQNP